jgi:hypothetical protein
MLEVEPIQARPESLLAIQLDPFAVAAEEFVG